MPAIEVINGEVFWVTRGKKAGATPARPERRERMVGANVQAFRQMAKDNLTPPLGPVRKYEALRMDPIVRKAELSVKEEIIEAAQPAFSVLCGIYFLIRDNRIFYVGQSVNIINRLTQHLCSESMAFDHWSWVPCAREQLDALERAYLDALVPEMNLDRATKALRNQALTTR